MAPLSFQQSYALPILVDNGGPDVCAEFDFPVLAPILESDELGSVDQFGSFSFPEEERIEATLIGPTTESTCSFNDDPNTPNLLLDIVNLNSVSFSDVWYIPDETTFVSNSDFFVVPTDGPGGTLLPSIRIDTVGSNQPLISESLNSDGIFEPGETWRFILQDYDDDLAADIPERLAFPGLHSGPSTIVSTGSIIGVPIDAVQPVGGTFIPIEATSLIVAGSQMIVAWLIPVLVSAVGIGLVFYRRR